MSYKKLRIQKPCSQPLMETSSVTNEKYCNSCKHTVHDFTEMSTPELVAMLQSGKYSCGIFDKEQLGTLYYVQDETRSKRKKYWNGIAAAIVAGTLQLSSAYSQSPVRTHKLYNRNLAFDKFQPESSPVVTEQEQTVVKKEKFEFTVLDEETHAPMAYAKVVMMGISGQTDEHGKISYDFIYSPDTIVKFVAELSYYKYEDKHIRLQLQACHKKMTVLYMHKKKHNTREVVYGYF
jgi:hypothetical protein